MADSQQTFTRLGLAGESRTDLGPNAVVESGEGPGRKTLTQGEVNARAKQGVKGEEGGQGTSTAGADEVPETGLL